MTLIASGTDCELREVKLSNKPAELIAASPKGTVPVLVLPDGRVIDESLDIMRWALEQNDPEGWLDGDDAELIATNDGPFKHHLDRYKYPGRHDSNPLQHRGACLTFIGAYESLLARQPCLRGPKRTLADVAIMPFVRQFAATDQQWFDLQPLPAVQAWLAGHVGSTLFGRTMERIPAWTSGQEPVLLGRS